MIHRSPLTPSARYDLVCDNAEGLGGENQKLGLGRSDCLPMIDVR